MSATAFPKARPRPTLEQTEQAMTGNICRCGTYLRISAAIQLAARRLAGDKA